MPKPNPNERIIAENGAEIKHFGLNHCGDQPSLVAINGLGSGIEPWGDLLTRISEERHVIAVDVRRAVGECALRSKSMTYELGSHYLNKIDGVPNVPNAPHMSDYAHAVMETVYGYELPGSDAPVDMLGFSNGALVVAQAAIDYPRAVNRTIYAGGAPGVIGEPPAPTAMVALSTPKRDADTLNGDTIKALYGGELGRKPHLAKELGIKRSIDEHTYNRQLHAAMSSLIDAHEYIKRTSMNTLASFGSWTPFTAMNTMMNQITPPRLTIDRLAEANKETLIIAGTEDPITPYSNALELHGRLSRSSLYTQEGDGHYGMLTDSKTAALAISGFLRARSGSHASLA